MTRSPYFRHWRLRAFFLCGLYKSCLVSNVCTSENADCFCPHVFDFCSSSCWRRLCGLSLFSSSWSPWGWITRLTNNMNVSILHSCGLFNLWIERKAFLEAMRLCCVRTMQHLSCFLTLNSQLGIGKLNGLHVLLGKQLLHFDMCILIALHNLNTRCKQGVKMHVLFHCTILYGALLSDVSSSQGVYEFSLITRGIGLLSVTDVER